MDSPGDTLTPSLFRRTEIDSSMYLGDPTASAYHADATNFLFDQSAPLGVLDTAAPCADEPVGPSADDDFSVFDELNRWVRVEAKASWEAAIFRKPHFSIIDSQETSCGNLSGDPPVHPKCYHVGSGFCDEILR